MADIRATAIAILNEVKVKAPIGSRDKPADFTKYTGYTQDQLTKLWAGGSQLTCCNEFVSWYSRELATQLKSPVIPLGNFSTEGWLAANRKHHAWVRPREGAKPFPGDIYRPVSFHMGVVYSCEDPGTLTSIDAGQGGPLAKQDIIKQLDRPFVVGNFQGWVDIEALFTDAPVHPVPQWLPGWWEVTIRQTKSWYYFGADYTVTRTKLKPASFQTPALAGAGQKINYLIEFGSIFILSWPTQGGHYEVETFGPRPFGGDSSMDGERDHSVNMSAAKLS